MPNTNTKVIYTQTHIYSSLREEPLCSTQVPPVPVFLLFSAPFLAVFLAVVLVHPITDGGGERGERAATFPVDASAPFPRHRDAAAVHHRQHLLVLLLRRLAVAVLQQRVQRRPQQLRVIREPLARAVFGVAESRRFPRLGEGIRTPLFAFAGRAYDLYDAARGARIRARVGVSARVALAAEERGGKGGEANPDGGGVEIGSVLPLEVVTDGGGGGGGVGMHSSRVTF
jgi:hypothetical protein